ncbi:MAG: 30S ribosomal protein THX [Aridibacter sp.]
MGKGDKKSKRGKIFAGSFGKTRPRKKNRKAETKKEDDKSEE